MLLRTMHRSNIPPSFQLLAIELGSLWHWPWSVAGRDDVQKRVLNTQNVRRFTSHCCAQICVAERPPASISVGGQPKLGQSERGKNRSSCAARVQFRKRKSKQNTEIDAILEATKKKSPEGLGAVGDVLPRDSASSGTEEAKSLS
uniref:Uncharacterized protein n=1 Tax=Ixodes ricinus TaxID=34613 RepID=A0A6B0UUY1_IXORI